MPKTLVENPEGKRQLGMPRHGWDDNINMDIKEIGYKGVFWSNMAQDKNQSQALVNMVIIIWVP
jgi:hypothetical protein